MPTLDWIGKKAVLNHHREVPYRLLKCDASLSAGDPDSGNLLIQGDNLLALKALLPYYAGKVKCIYIDPPYNTGNEKWVYNDAVNSPEMQRWLGKVVGAEAEDLSRHDKWLCMMYPRLSLLKDFLTEDGAIFISIDDNEVQNLRAIMDEVFGPRNFVSTVIWQKVYSPKNTARHLSEDHDYIVIYACDSDCWQPHLVSRSEKQDKAYKNRDNDKRGPWKTVDLSARNFYGAGTYPITCPSGRVITRPPKGRYWQVSPEKFMGMDADKRIWWGIKGDSIPQIKRFLTEVKQGVVPQTLWTYQEVGHTQEAKKELIAICDFEDSASVFISPKPLRLLKRILEIGTDKDSLILDSFAGSGTTGHAVLALNKQDGGTRRFILAEMEDAISRSITAQRLARAVDGYASRTVASISDQREQDRPSEIGATGEPMIPVERKAGKRVEGLGGGFRYCNLGEPLFDEAGNIRETVTFPDLAAHVFFTETGAPIPKRATAKTPLLGEHNGKAIYLLFNGVLGDKSTNGGNVLTNEILRGLPGPTIKDGTRVIYGEGCRLGAARLKREGIVFKQVPYEIKVG
ncbi:MAG: site-specific DNA-methyltransferase [Terriglobia bacterium]|jgi:site-specific DNA-methyltransferase (adenine-specific)/adenine-specific DNA-methyltransferase